MEQLRQLVATDGNGFRFEPFSAPSHLPVRAENSVRLKE
jgi:hypothetical protein